MIHPYLWCRNVIRSTLRGSILGNLIRQLSAKPAKGVVHIVSATRLSEAEFWSKSALGKSLLDYRSRPDLKIYIQFSNAEGLSIIYNRYIDATNDSDILVFVHDDVWLESHQDLNWLDSIRIGVNYFDVIGVAGNVRLGPTQPAWLFRSLENSQFVWDHGYLTGSVGHGKKPTLDKDSYGPVPMECKALDGVLLAMRGINLKRSRLHFDARFKFHFYDLDFCREATKRGLVMGTWMIPLTHESGGSFGTTSWSEGFNSYLEKWSKA
ncbi:glycosyltransferase [Rhodoferax sp. GW822-FHT02A01]|uniref:glycosyltransferase n=1 Tax=Rhodoferax sp. GW822-FHT02A01 TaxID=3141537 RepID=UPI00315D4545